MAVTLKTRNYRGLRSVDWTPRGVCALTGPNGSGKTTLLTILELLRNAYLRSWPEAIANPYVGGIVGLKNYLAAPDEPVELSVSTDGSTWSTELLLSGGTIDGRCPERAVVNGTLEYERAAFADELKYITRGHNVKCGDRLALRAAYDHARNETLDALAHAFQRVRVYRDYDLWKLRQFGSPLAGDLYLHPSGANLFAVLYNWSGRKDLRPQYDFVRDSLTDAFPEFFSDLDFVVGGQNIFARFYLRGLPQEVPHHLAPDGLLVALLHLTALAGAQRESFIAIDEVENSLHPYAIRELISAFRRLSDQTGLTVALSTHSPVVLDEFASEPSHVFVMESGEETLPVPLSEHRDPEWLAHFSLGSLYSSLDYGAPRVHQPAVAAEAE